ncbi:MAG: carboxypeptidase-like regulatory domain-containing protein [bacterium]
MFRTVHLTLCLNLLVFLALTGELAAQSSGQARIIGRVRDAATGQPLSNVNVFIANSMLGSATNGVGFYSIAHVPLGTHKLVVSRIGYAVQTSKVWLTKNVEKRIDFALKPAVLQAPEIEVIEPVSSEWKKNFKKFKEMFLGTSRNARKCKLLNPEVLDFKVDNQNHTFRATASQMLEIENRALGYHIDYFLEGLETKKQVVQYRGLTKFKPLTPKNAKENKKWQKNRLKTYKGSFRHFLAALIAHRLEEEGFLLYECPFGEPVIDQTDLNPVDAQGLISEGDYPFERKLHFLSFLQVNYTEALEEREYIYWRLNKYSIQTRESVMAHRESLRPREQISWILMNRTYANVDTTGYLFEPLAVKTYGYWAWKRVADMLPLEYRPK